MIEANEVGHLKILDYEDYSVGNEQVLLIEVTGGLYKCLWLESGKITPVGDSPGWDKSRIVKDRSIQGIKDGPKTTSDFDMLMMIYPKSAEHLSELRGDVSK